MSSIELPAAPGTAQIEGARWLAEKTRDPQKTLTRWRAGTAAPVPVGDTIVVVRVLDDRLGRAAFHTLQERAPQHLGPVIANQALGAVEFLLPARPAVWQGTGTALLDGARESTREVKCPPLDRRASGRMWLNRPSTVPGFGAALTDPFALARALDTARAQLAQAGHRLTA
ncbi:hypothetical protein AB0D10_00910 [Kitasatospora sp. NPDC048545]|uniref:hypothetical protein n=1 Tax=Kitasatospora sp. NPDC048545 TaxID=3157208 RepID=UPI0033E4B533